LKYLDAFGPQGLSISPASYGTELIERTAGEIVPQNAGDANCAAVHQLSPEESAIYRGPLARHL